MAIARRRISAALGTGGGKTMTGEDIDALVGAGQLEPWKGALLAEWLRTPAAREERGPTPAELEALLRDPAVMARLRAVSGPWDALLATARS